VSDEEIEVEEQPDEAAEKTERELKQFVSQPRKTKPWERRRTKYGDGRYVENPPKQIPRQKERRCNSSLDDIRMQDDVHRMLAETCRKHAAAQRAQNGLATPPSEDVADISGVRKRINSLREEMAQLCSKRMGHAEDHDGLTLPSKARNVLLANFMDGGTHHSCDDEDLEKYGYSKPSPKKAARQSYQSLFDSNVTMLNKKSNIPEIPRSFTVNKYGLLKRRTDADHGEFAPRIEKAMNEAKARYDAQLNDIVNTETATNQTFPASADESEEGIQDQLRDTKRRFFNKCSRRSVLPLGGPLKHLVETLGHVDMSHYRIGDNLLESLAPELQKLSNPVLSLKLKDNGLTEKGGGALMDLLKKSAMMKDLTCLDISDNRVGNYAIETLATVVKQNGTLVDLNVAANQLGNHAIGYLTHGLTTNDSLTELNLASNCITETGTEGIEQMLQNNASITSLNLSYNMIRRKAAAGIMQALTNNKSLKILDVSWNAFGLAANGIKRPQEGLDNHVNDAIAMFAQVLETNETLTTVNLAHNGVEEQGTLSLANVLPHNTTLTQLILDSNSLGFQGGRAILAIITNPESPKREISLKNCSFCDFTCSCGALANEDASERKKCSCGFAKSLNFNPDHPSGKYSLDLSNPSDRSVIKTMIHLAASMEGTNMHTVKLNGQVWHDFDEDDPKLKLPTEGILTCEFVQTKSVPMQKSLIHEQNFADITSMLKNLGAVPRLRVLRALSKEYTFETTMVPTILTAFEYGQNTIEAIAIIFGRIVDHENMHKTCEELVHENGLKKLREIIGPLYTFHRDNPCGHYRLDLANEHAHTVLTLLATVSFHHVQAQQEAKAFDLSQHGDYECFRNETLDNAPIEIRSEDVTAKSVQFQTTSSLLVRKKGILEFDFVPSSRPPAEAQEIPEKSIDRLVKKVRRMKKEPEELARFLRWEAHSNYFLVKQIVDLLDVAADDAMRQEMVTIFWNRVLDEENITTKLLPSLNEKVQAELRDRIGPLKLFNPLKPSLHYTLNLQMRDERLVARFLLELAAKEYPEVEAGVGLQPAGTFDEQKGDEKGPVEMKKVPELWLEAPPEGGIPTTGIWSVMYDPPLVELQPEVKKADDGDAEDSDEEERDDDDEDSEEHLQRRREATDQKHLALRKMLAVTVLGWKFPEEEPNEGK